MVGMSIHRNLLPAMNRSALLLVVVFACTLAAGGARAQDASELLTRIDRLESALRTLTGSVEQLQYRNQQLEQQVQRLQAEVQGGTPAASAVPARPAPQYCAARRRAGDRGRSAAGSVHRSAAADGPPRRRLRSDGQSRRTRGAASAGRSTAANEPPPPVSDAPAPGPRQLGAPLDLSNLSAPAGSAPPGGQLPPPPPANPSATGTMQATLPPGNTAKDAYDLAYGYVLHKDYALAADTFRLFLRQYPSDRLAPEAQYWLGESFYQQQQYRDAAESFLAVSTKYDSTARAPEALLRLGQSLAALGEKEAACASLGEVLRKYPRASQSIKQSVEREQKRGHC